MTIKNTSDASFKKTEQTVTRNETVPQIADEFVKNPPNNLGLDNPEEQAMQNDLIGNQNTEAINDAPQSEAERKRVAELAEQLSRKK